MRLFGVVDGIIDRRDRAHWLSPPFDRGRALTATLGSVAAAQAQSPTAVEAGVYSTGALEAHTFCTGAVASQVKC